MPYEEVSVSPDADPASLVGLLVQPPPFRPEQVEHRVTVSGRPRTSIIPRELVNATDTPSAIAAREAATGRWLEDLDRGHLTAVAPGLGLAAPVWGSPPDRAPAQVEPAPSAARDDRIVKGKVTASNLFDGVWLAKGAARDSDEDEAVAEDENLDFLDAQGGAKVWHERRGVPRDARHLDALMCYGTLRCRRGCRAPTLAWGTWMKLWRRAGRWPSLRPWQCRGQGWTAR